VNSGMHWEGAINPVCRFTGRPCSREFGDAMGDKDRVNSEIHSKAVIEEVWRCTWKPRSCQLRDACGGHEGLSLQMHWEAVIVQVRRCTCRLYWNEISGVLGGGRSGGSRWVAHQVL
jgi:hypothetical protein